MFKLRQQQFDALEEANQENLVRRICEYLKEELPEWTEAYADQELQLFVLDCIDICKVIPIESEQGIAKYCCIALDAEVDFGLEEETYNFLVSGTDPETQLDLLIETVLKL